MALKENSQPKYPSGPVRDNSKYTTSPTTTEGTAKNVFSKVSTAPRPANRATPSQAPSTSPTAQAMAQATALTARERPTMVSRLASREVMRSSAVAALSVNEVMGRIFELRYGSHRSNYQRYELPCIGSNSTTPCPATAARR